MGLSRKSREEVENGNLHMKRWAFRGTGIKTGVLTSL